MTDKINTAPELKHPYRSPNTKVVLIKVQGMLCSSPIGETNATEMEEGDDNW